MKIKTLMATALIVAAWGGSSSVARASLVTNTGDLFLGFRQGESKGYLVDLGSITQFSLRNGTSFTVNTGGNISLDLASNAGFGPNWATAGNVLWGAVATTFYDASTPAVLFATSPRLDPNVQSSPWVGRSNSGQIGTASKFQSLATKYGVEGVATANSTKATFQGSGENTWAGFTGPQFDFGIFGGIDADFANGTANSVLDLYQINPGSERVSEFLGTFRITDAGVITFTAVPEPGTIALFGIGAILVLFHFRRRVYQRT